MWEAPYPPYDSTDTKSFAYETVQKRWPIILTGIIDNVYRFNHDLGLNLEAFDDAASQVAKDKIAEGKGIIETIGKLKYDMGRDRTLEPIPDDGEAMVEIYNNGLESLAQQGKNSWFTAPWLFSECYLYRLIRSFFLQTKHWRQHDPFLLLKEDTFRKSSDAIYKLGTTMHELQHEKDELSSDPAKLSVLFKEMIQMCLWGNATDLSMLTNVSHNDIQDLQAVGREAQIARQHYILHDDQDNVWAHLTTLKDARIDFVLDNAGFELFTDFVFADFLVTYTPYVSKVVFHPKLIPWFVSDVTPPDFASSITSLLSTTFFPPSNTPASLEALESQAHLKEMVERWQSYISAGVFSLSVPPDVPLGYSDSKANFWTSPFPYWNMKEQGPEVFNSLVDSGLVIFKGDLNFRKLTGDVRWPASTPFEDALGPLAGSFPILSLRTNKADVVVGVDTVTAERLDKSGEKWRYNGKYALVSFLPRVT